MCVNSQDGPGQLFTTRVLVHRPSYGWDNLTIKQISPIWSNLGLIQLIAHCRLDGKKKYKVVTELVKAVFSPRFFAVVFIFRIFLFYPPSFPFPPFSISCSSLSFLFPFTITFILTEFAKNLKIANSLYPVLHHLGPLQIWFRDWVFLVRYFRPQC